MTRSLPFLMILLPSLCFSQEQDKSIWFPEKKYTDHSRISFGYIRSRSLPFNHSLSAYAPLPQTCPDSLSDQEWLLAYYTQTIQQAYRENHLDRAFLTDSIANQQIREFEAPSSAYRLFTTRTRRSDKIKYLRYTISKGIPILIGFDRKPSDERLVGQSTWDGTGSEDVFQMLIIGYDSPTASFQLVGTEDDQWGDQGYIWMTYRDLLAQAKEILCLRNPIKAKRPQNTARLSRPINLQIGVTIQQLEQGEDKAGQLKQQSVHFDYEQQSYQLYGQSPARVDDRYQIQLQIPKGRCTYLFVAHPDGSTTPAWMLEYNPRDTIITLPPVSYYQFPDAGTHYFFILNSYQVIPRWRRYVDRYEYDDRQVDAQNKLYRAFQDYLLPSGKITYPEENMQLHTKANQAEASYVLPLIIQWPIQE